MVTYSFSFSHYSCTWWSFVFILSYNNHALSQRSWSWVYIYSFKLNIYHDHIPNKTKLNKKSLKLCADVSVHCHLVSDNVDLGTACGKYYRVCCLSIIDPGKTLAWLDLLLVEYHKKYVPDLIVLFKNSSGDSDIIKSMPSDQWGLPFWILENCPFFFLLRRIASVDDNSTLLWWLA